VTNSSSETYLPYEQIRNYATEHPVQQAVVPGEYSRSLPLPTRRLSVAGYAMFAGPAVRSPGRPPVYGIPDVWMLWGAQKLALVFFANTAAASFSSTPLTGPVTVSPDGRSIASIQEDLRALERLMNRAVPVFFAGEQGDAALRTDLRETLRAVLPSGTTDWYDQLTPDWWAWLGDSEAPQ
jgi:hypothetical protein